MFLVAMLRLSSFFESMGIDTEDVMTLFQALLQKGGQKRAEKVLNDIERVKNRISLETGSSTPNILAHIGIIVLVPILD